MSENFDNFCYAFGTLTGAQSEEQPEGQPDAADEQRAALADPAAPGSFPDPVPAAMTASVPFSADAVSTEPAPSFAGAAAVAPAFGVTPPAAQPLAPLAIVEEGGERMVEVLSASGCEFVERGRAERRQDLVVDSTGRYWERGFYESLHSADAEDAAEAKAA
jgi:hypothetical protein